MRIRNRAALLIIAGAIPVTAIAVSAGISKQPVPPALAEASLWSPDPLTPPRFVEFDTVRLAPVRADTAPGFRAVSFPPAAVADVTLPAIEPPLITWSREIASGETLDAVLADAGLAASARAEIALALGAEYDLRRLRPGHAVTLVSKTDGNPRRVELAVDDGVRIEAIFGDGLATRVLEPDPEMVTFAGEAVVETSIFDAFDKVDIPARFAVDLAQMLGGTVDFRRELSGGETMRLLWREAREGEQMIGQPELTFAALDLGETLFEIVWPEDGSGRAAIYRDGEVMRIFAQPVEGARLSSVFGRRQHPVYGNVRMHTGVDFAAAYGTPVYATAPGRVSFIGRRGGYGRVVEIAHGPDTMTRYAHLSAVPEGLAPGERVAAGDFIGRVGTTGTTTGPNLHYEVRVDGRPTDPLSDDRLAEAAERSADDGTAFARLRDARARLEERLASVLVTDTSERF